GSGIRSKNIYIFRRRNHQPQRRIPCFAVTFRISSKMTVPNSQMCFYIFVESNYILSHEPKSRSKRIYKRISYGQIKMDSVNMRRNDMANILQHIYIIYIFCLIRNSRNFSLFPIETELESVF